jgi:RNA polymerase sigma-70 factor (ECF subfamily)
MIHAAAAGSREDRSTFALRYAPAIRAYLGARWRGTPRVEHIDDAVQEVFLECFRPGGALEHAGEGRGGGFRAYLYGLVRNVALRVEERRGRAKEFQPPSGIVMEDVASSERTLSSVFDRAWAEVIVQEAAARQAEMAPQKGPAAERRLEILRLRFHENLPIREIARLWDDDPARLHHEYALAKDEFRSCLLEVIRFHDPSATRGDAERECETLLGLLG